MRGKWPSVEVRLRSSVPKESSSRARRLPPAPSDQRGETGSTRRLDHSCFRHQAARQTEGTGLVLGRATYNARYQRTTYAIVITPFRQSLPATTLDKDERALARRGKVRESTQRVRMMGGVL